MSDRVINVDIEINEKRINVSVDGNEKVLSAGIEEQIVKGGTRDYEKLKNLPSINGERLIGNYDEIDPTVPSWAKEQKKPEYSPEEIGAISEDDEMSFSDIKEVWDSIFTKG